MNAFSPLLSAVGGMLNTGRCLRDIERFWSFRSTVPGAGQGQASRFLLERYREIGLAAELHAYPADDRTEWLDGRTNPLAWTPHAARLEVAAPAESAGLICSFEQEPLVLLSSSASTPHGGVTAPVVVIRSGTKDSDYEGLEVRGKILFTDAWPGLLEEQARKRGAVGIISDSVCPPWLKHHPPLRRGSEVPDLTMWATLSGRGDSGLWGFSLTPRQGTRLRLLIRKSRTPVLLHAEVTADLREGTSDLVTAVLPGTDLAAEEVWVLSHSSEPGALDNASGCCLSLEIGRVLKMLVDSGELPPLRRTLRFLHAVEVDGYLPYLTGRLAELGRVAAAISLDSVGADFRLWGGQQMIFRSPDSNATYADSLLASLAAAVAAEPNADFTPDQYDLFPWGVEPFFLGNDNFVAEGFFDIPAPMLCDWPEKFYHSNQDTVEKFSPNSLGRSGVIAAAYLYLLTTASGREAGGFIHLAELDWQRRISEECSRAALSGEEPAVIRALARHLALLGQDAVRGVLRLAPGSAGLEEQAARGAARLEQHARLAVESAFDLFPGARSAPADAPPGFPTDRQADAGRVLKPLRWKLPGHKKISPGARAGLARLREQAPDIEKAWDWLNGRRSLQEVWDRLQFPNPVPASTLIAFCDLLCQENLAVECSLDPKDKEG